MDEEFGQVAVQMGGQQQNDGPMAAGVSKAAQRIVKAQLDTALKMLEENRAHIDRLSETLLDKNRLTREDLESILPPLRGKEETGND